MYYAVKLDEETRQRILERAKLLCPIPDGWKIYCDHITMCHSSHKDWPKWDKVLHRHLGTEMVFRITGYGKSDYAIALSVDLYTANLVSHITIACAPGAKPVQSNGIKNWVVPNLDLIQPFTGTLELCR